MYAVLVEGNRGNINFVCNYFEFWPVVQEMSFKEKIYRCRVPPISSQ